MLSHYALLNIKPGAGQEIVEEAFTRFKWQIARYAPGIDFREADIAKMFPDIWLAYQTLLDSQSREAYEKELMIQGAEVPQISSELLQSEPVNFWSNIVSVLKQAGFIIILLLFIYALVHFGAF